MFTIYLFSLFFKIYTFYFYLLLPKGALLFQPRKVGAISLQNSSFSSSSYYSSVFFPIFPFPEKFRNRNCFCSCCWWVSGEIEIVNLYCLEKTKLKLAPDFFHIFSTFFSTFSQKPKLKKIKGSYHLEFFFQSSPLYFFSNEIKNKSLPFSVSEMWCGTYVRLIIPRNEKH